MRAEFLQRLAREEPTVLAKAFTASLVDFGYAITQDKVQEYIQRWQDGTPPAGGPEMFVHGWLNNGTDD